MPGLIESVTPMPEAPCALLTVSFCDAGALPPAWTVNERLRFGLVVDPFVR